jgi:hypothetical protein
MTVFESLVALATKHGNKGYLRSYKNDLMVHDCASLAKAETGARFVWILRESGTALFPVAVGHDSAWCTAWLTTCNSSAIPSLAFEIKITGAKGNGTVKAITYAEATRLAKIPHETGRKIRVSLSGCSHENVPSPY